MIEFVVPCLATNRAQISATTHSTMTRSAEDIAKAAKKAFQASQKFSSEERSNALLAVRQELELNKDRILEANKKDMEVTT